MCRRRATRQPSALRGSIAQMAVGDGARAGSLGARAILSAMAVPMVALVGRPNVGKSTLFNRLVGERLAIVEEVPATTRDRLMARAEWGGRSFDVVDTGGLDLAPDGEIDERVRNQAQLAIEQADVIVLLLDASLDTSLADDAVADLLRRSGKPVVVAANKAEAMQRQLDAAALWRLGLGEPVPISALHGTGTGDLLEAVLGWLPAAEPEIEEEGIPIAIVGRPNVGKSSLLNRIIGHERTIVSSQPGTTRDAIDVPMVHAGQRLLLVDTAGIRRRGRIEPGIERHSVLRAMRAIERSDVAVLVLDAVEGVAAQDAHIAGFIEEAGKGALLVVNKWDLVAKDTRSGAEYTRYVRDALKFLSYAPILFVSAKTAQRVAQVPSGAIAVYHARRQRVSTGTLNRFVADAQARHSPPSKGRRRLKILYATQAGVAPPTFVFFVNGRDLVHFSYARFVENQLRQLADFEGTPLKLVFRERRARQVRR
jgi:GTP-binding protein